MSSSRSNRSSVSYESFIGKGLVVADFYMAPNQMVQYREIPCSDQSGNTKICDLTRQEYSLFSRPTWHKERKPTEKAIASAKDFIAEYSPREGWIGNEDWLGKIDEHFTRGSQASTALKDYRSTMMKISRGYMTGHVTTSRESRSDGKSFASWFDNHTDRFLGRHPPLKKDDDQFKRCIHLNEYQTNESRQAEASWDNYVVEDVCHSADDKSYKSCGIAEGTTHNFPLIKLVKTREGR